MSEICSDVLLLLIKNFLDSVGEAKLAKKVSKQINHEVQISEKYQKKFNLNRMIKHYLKEHEDLKHYLEKVTKQILEAENEDSSSSEEEKKELKQKRKKSESSTKEKDKQAKRKNSDSVSNKKKATNKKVEEEDDGSDFDIDPKKMKEKLGLKIDPQVNTQKLPFCRIDSSKYQVDNHALADNSYEHYAKVTGYNGGIEANNRLKVTAGRDFRKEKTKFKNKSGFGNSAITMDVKSTRLDYGEESD